MGNKNYEASDAPPEDREWFLRENAAAVVAEKDLKIARLRERVRKLENVNRSMRRQLVIERAERERLREALRPFAEVGRKLDGCEWVDATDYLRAVEALGDEG
jgi:inactivated superfamily I helicase